VIDFYFHGNQCCNWLDFSALSRATRNNARIDGLMSKKCHVLAVEDDPLVQDLFAQILTGEGFDFSVAANG
jgi:hypothetical protein